MFLSLLPSGYLESEITGCPRYSGVNEMSSVTENTLFPHDALPLTVSGELSEIKKVSVPENLTSSGFVNWLDERWLSVESVGFSVYVRLYAVFCTVDFVKLAFPMLFSMKSGISSGAGSCSAWFALVSEPVVLVPVAFVDVFAASELPSD